MRAGARETGAVDGTVAIFETLMDQRSIFLTGNTESIYASTWLNLEEGPIVFESPPNVLGVVDDFCFPYVAYLGNAEPDKGWFVILGCLARSSPSSTRPGGSARSRRCVD